MLDIRAVAYIAPLSEVDFAPVPLTVRLVNYADETGLVSAGFRIYNDSTGLLIYQSDIIPVEIAKGETVDVSALTDYMPPAPADDTYFVLFDGNAANALVPDGINIHLGSFYFDVKPAPLGPIPAGHAVTHEDTGIDEVDVTGLAGLLADPQTPIPHSGTHALPSPDAVYADFLASLGNNTYWRLSPDGAGGVKWNSDVEQHHTNHEVGGGPQIDDEIDVTGLSGLLADAQTPAAHGNAEHTSTFEDQANKGAAGGYCGLPNPLDPTLPLRADGTPARPVGIFYELEHLCADFSVVPPWFSALILSGTQTYIPGTPQHPGILRYSSFTNANSGAANRFRADVFSLFGSEQTDIVLRPQTLAGTTMRFGFLDTTTVADAVDGCYLESVAGLLVGKTATNSTRSTTGTNYQMVTNTWYRLRVTLDPTAARVDFYLYSEAGALLWTDNLTTNIPTGAGNECGHGIIATNSGTTAVTLVDVDYLNIWIARSLTR